MTQTIPENCPFCGKESTLVNHYRSRPRKAYCDNIKCGAFHRAIPLPAWQTRHERDALLAVVRNLVDGLKNVAVTAPPASMRDSEQFCEWAYDYSYQVIDEAAPYLDSTKEK